MRTTDAILASLLDDDQITDVHIHADKAVRIRRFGQLEAVPTDKVEPLTQAEVTHMIEETISGRGEVGSGRTDDSASVYRDMLNGPAGSTSYPFLYQDDDGIGSRRVRATAFRAKRRLCLCLRLMPAQIPAWDDLGIPHNWAEFLGLPRGLILVCGMMGSGKSTTCAAMIDHVCRLLSKNIVTLEDPIEYEFEDGHSLVAQREIGVDVDTWERGLRSGLRQDGTMLFCGELRSPEAVLTALEGAETSQLVLATLHANGAADAVERIVEMFPETRTSMIRNQLARVLTASICQWLLPGSRGNCRVLGYEVLVCKGNPAVASPIREGRVSSLYDAMQAGGALGMITIQQCLDSLIGAGKINRDIAHGLVAGLHRSKNDK